MSVRPMTAPLAHRSHWYLLIPEAIAVAAKATFMVRLPGNYSPLALFRQADLSARGCSDN
jgi:hypothetical protein